MLLRWRLTALVLGLFASACEAESPNLALPPIKDDQSVIVSTYTSDAFNVFAHDARHSEPIKLEVPPDTRLDIEAWIYDRSLEELRLTPGPIPELTPSQTPPTPGQRWRAAWTGGKMEPFAESKEVAPEWTQRIRVPPLCARITKIERVDFPTDGLLNATSTLPDGDGVLIQFGTRFFALRPDAPAQELTLTTTIAPFSVYDAYTFDHEIYLGTDHGVFFAVIKGNQLELGEHVADGAVIHRLAVFSGLSGPIMVGANIHSGSVFRAQTGGHFEKVAEFPASVNAFISRTPTLDGTGIILAHEFSSDLMIVGRDSVASIPAGTSGLTAVTEVPDFGIVTGTGLGDISYYANGEWHPIPMSPFGVLVGALIPFREGFVATGASGLLVEHSAFTGFCEAHEIQSGVIRWVAPFGTNQWVMAARKNGTASVSVVSWD